MLLPIVSQSTRERVWAEVRDVEARDGCFALEIMQSLSHDGEGKNPLIQDFLYGLVDPYGEKPWFPKAIGYGCFVYRMLELESGGNLPIVMDSVATQMQREFFSHPKRFVRSIMQRIVKENFQIAVANNDFVWMEALSDNPAEQDAAFWVFTIGAVVYRLLEGQIEGDRLSRMFQ